MSVGSAHAVSPPLLRRSTAVDLAGPRTRYLNEVSCSTPTGPRACILPVAMPISAPMPNSPPSANCVEALCSRIAESISLKKRSTAAASSATIASVWCEEKRLDMLDRLADAVDQLRRDDRVEIFGRPVGLGRRRPPAGKTARTSSVAADFAAGLWPARRGAARDASRRRRGRPAASRPRRRCRCAASWR